MKVEVQGFRAQRFYAGMSLSVDDFTVNFGSKTAIFGENGAGKSTFLKSMAFYDHYSIPGSRIKGADFDFSGFTPKIERAQKILYLGSDLQSPFNLSVMSYLELLIETFALHKGSVLELIEKVCLTHLLNQSIATLSSGEKQMLLLSRAMLQKPKVVLIDETFSQLDLWNQEFWVNEIKTKGNFATWFVVSHDLALLKELCDEALIFKKGECIFRGLSQDILSKGELSRFK